MERLDRFHKIIGLMRERITVPFAGFIDELEVSPATLKRDIEHLRNVYKAPIEWDRDREGYYLTQSDWNELPGLWFNPTEIYALLTMQHLLTGLEPGLLAPHVRPLQTRLRKLLSRGNRPPEEIERRIRIIRLAARPVQEKFFGLAATATLERKRLHVSYWARSTDETTVREISPQRLVFYRDNWLLDAWCHLRNDLRSFSVDGIRRAELLGKPAKNVAESDLDEHLASGYGIYSGKHTQWARLKFSPTAARWVRSEEWHPQQKSSTEMDGSYVLEIPYSGDRELVMDIMRHGEHVEVLAPEALRARVKAKFRAALKAYG